MAGWKTSRRTLSLDRPLVMAILNVTPDSFSDGGKFLSPDDALRKAETLIGESADILDIGGESTRPGGTRVGEDEELNRVLPVIKAIAKRFDITISVDTTRSAVAQAALAAGAEIVNDISGLRFDQKIAKLAADAGAGLVLMHSRGSFETLHSQPPVGDILAEVIGGLRGSINIAKNNGVADEQIAVDIGLGFGKMFEQNLELIAKLGKIVDEFKEYPVLVGASRKSFIGKILGNAPAGERLGGSLAAAVVAVLNGAKIVRVHDVKETVNALRMTSRITSPPKL
jgi:dihydropteroate synthase